MIASAVNDLPASFEQLAATQSNVGRMRAAGVEVAIGMIDDNDTRYLFNERQYAGNLVALGKVPGATGVSWGEALAMITSRAGRSDRAWAARSAAWRPAGAATSSSGRAIRSRSAATPRRCGSTASASRSRPARPSFATATAT